MIALGWVVNLIERGEASMGRIHAILDARARDRGRGAARGGRDPRRRRVPRPELRLRRRRPGAPRHRARGARRAHRRDRGPHRLAARATLVSLLPRLFDPPPGTVFVDGHDVRRLPLAALRGAIGFVPQETLPVLGDGAREHRASGRGQRRRAPSGPPASPSSTEGRARVSRSATRPPSASAASRSRAARSSARRSRARSRPTRAS